jgi:hypothetical protein
VVVPLGDLDRHSRATTHIADEADRLVPLFTASELNGFLSSGLVSYAAMIIPELDERLVEHLRAIPAKAGANPRPAGDNPQDAADEAFEIACKELLDKFDTKGLELLKAIEFRLALAAITSSVQLVVEVDPEDGRTRVFSYSFFRPIGVVTPARRSNRRLRASWKRRRPLRAFKRLGTTSLQIDLGPVGGCERYQLNAEAPFDTWFASAEMHRGRAGAGSSELARAAAGRGNTGSGAMGGTNGATEQIDTSQRFRISYTRASSSGPWSGVLRVQLRTVYTGVTRASVYASLFLAVGALVGTWHVLCAPKHLLIGENTEAVAALLLLFPGIAASAVAGVARNTLTATMQFPMRLTLWGMSCGSFVLATAAAFGLGGRANVYLWIGVTAGVCLAAIGLFWRSRTWITRPSRRVN